MTGLILSLRKRNRTAGLPATVPSNEPQQALADVQRETEATEGGQPSQPGRAADKDSEREPDQAATRGPLRNARERPSSEYSSFLVDRSISEALESAEIPERPS